MIEEPDFVTQSGREHLSLADRVGLLKSDLLWLQQHRPGGAQTHDHNNLIGAVQGTILGCGVHSKDDTWGRINLSKTECRVLAWRRGGHDEHKRVLRLAYPRSPR